MAIREVVEIIALYFLVLIGLYTAARVITKGVMRSYSESKERCNYANTTEEKEGESSQEKTFSAEEDAEEEKEKNGFRRSGENEEGITPTTEGRSRG